MLRGCACYDAADARGLRFYPHSIHTSAILKRSNFPVATCAYVTVDECDDDVLLRNKAFSYGILMPEIVVALDEVLDVAAWDKELFVRHAAEAQHGPLLSVAYKLSRYGSG